MIAEKDCSQLSVDFRLFYDYKGKESTRCCAQTACRRKTNRHGYDAKVVTPVMAAG